MSLSYVNLNKKQKTKQVTNNLQAESFANSLLASSIHR